VEKEPAVVSNLFIPPITNQGFPGKQEDELDEFEEFLSAEKDLYKL
jgi:hypothetical protein